MPNILLKADDQDVDMVHMYSLPKRFHLGTVHKDVLGEIFDHNIVKPFQRCHVSSMVVWVYAMEKKQESGKEELHVA